MIVIALIAQQILVAGRRGQYSEDLRAQAGDGEQWYVSPIYKLIFSDD